MWPVWKVEMRKQKLRSPAGQVVRVAGVRVCAMCICSERGCARERKFMKFIKCIAQMRKKQLCNSPLIGVTTHCTLFLKVEVCWMWRKTYVAAAHNASTIAAIFDESISAGNAWRAKMSNNDKNMILQKKLWHIYSYMMWNNWVKKWVRAITKQWWCRSRRNQRRQGDISAQMIRERVAVANQT